MNIDLDSPIVAAMYEAASRRAERRNYLGMSQIGDGCARKLWYSFRGFTPVAPDGRLQMIFSMGDRVEEEVLKWLDGAGYHVEGRQEGFSALGGLFRGHCDGIIDGVTQRRHILEIKSANSARFKAFRENGVGQVAPIYAAQIQCYMGYSGIDRALWLVMNKNTCELLAERATFDRAEFERLEARAKRIISSNVEPPRAYKPGARECEFCDYRGHCRTDVHIQKDRTCGTCYSCQFNGLQPKCTFHNHEIKYWGRVCDDWQWREDVDAVPF